MAKPINTFSLGLTVIVILGLFFGTLLFIGGSDLFAPKTVGYRVRYPASAPLPDELGTGAPVFCGLQKVGDVTGVSQKAPGDDAASHPELFVYVDFAVVETLPLRADCRIVVRGPLLGGGGKLVILDPGWRGERLAAGALIEGHQTGTFDSALETLAVELDPNQPGALMAEIKMQLDAGNAKSLIAKVHRSINDINAITSTLAREAEPGDRDAIVTKLETVVDNINGVTGELRKQVVAGPRENITGKVHHGLDALNAALDLLLSVLEHNRENINETLASARRTAETLDRRIATPIADELDAGLDESLMAKVHVSFDRLNRSLDDVNVVSGDLREVVVLNKSRLNGILANVSEMSAHLRSAAKEVRWNPWRLLYRPGLEETRELNIFDASREFSTAAQYLDDAAAQLRALMEARGGEIASDDPELKEIADRLQQTFKRYTEAENALWQSLSK